MKHPNRCGAKDSRIYSFYFLIFIRMNSKGIERIKTLDKLNGKDTGWMNKDLYRILYHQDIYIVAYERIKSKAGSMTNGVDNTTIDGTSMKTIENIISEMKAEKFQFKPAKRVFIPKANGKKRPLGIATPKDRLVQESMRMILEAIYEQSFSTHSHGFRPAKSCHTALKEIRKWDGTNWLVEGDIKSCFDAIPHNTIIEVLRKRIKDERFLTLVWKALKAGYMTFNRYENSLAGTPQGSIVSPILANIVLHEFDIQMEDYIQRNNLGQRKGKKNPEYRKVQTKVERTRKELATADDQEKPKIAKRLKEYRKEFFHLQPFLDAGDFKRITYVRYADDWLVGIIGSKEDAIKVKNFATKAFNNLGLELSQEKTKITHAKTQTARFLGVDINIGKPNTKISVVKRNGTSFTKRTAGWNVKMTFPTKDIVKRLHLKGYCKHDGTPTRNKAFEHMDDVDITNHYNDVWRGYLNYYSFVDNYSKFHYIQYILKFSLAHTLASKHRIKLQRLFYQKGKNLTTRVIDNEGKEKVYSFDYKPHLKADKNRFKFQLENIDIIKGYMEKRTKSSLGAKCIICNSDDRIEMHHVRHIRKRGDKVEGFTKIMSNLNRKQLPVCHACHQKIHKGEYDGISLRKLQEAHRVVDKNEKSR
jgi:group II intron reverse transcriptase/maturase